MKGREEVTECNTLLQKCYINAAQTRQYKVHSVRTPKRARLAEGIRKKSAEKEFLAKDKS